MIAILDEERGITREGVSGDPLTAIRVTECNLHYTYFPVRPFW